ncbi:MAG: cytochrome c biogenesis protein CcsA [Sedimenticola sp.]
MENADGGALPSKSPASRGQQIESGWPLNNRYAIILINMSNNLTAFFAIACYFCSTLIISIRLFSGEAGSRIPRFAGIAAGLAGIVIHALLLYQSIHSEGGINLSFFVASSLISWSILVLLMISSISKPVENLGMLLLPLAILTIVLEMHFPSSRILPIDAPRGLLAHIIISLLAYSILALASVQAVLLAIQDHHLHHRHPGGFIRALPPLQTMETLLFEMMALGFVLLTLALPTGFLFLEDMFAQHLVHKTILSVISWLVFGTLLWGRFRFGWRGQKALIWTLVGFVVLMLAYFGSKAVVELVLS